MLGYAHLGVGDLTLACFSAQLWQPNVSTAPGRRFGGPASFRISCCVEDRTLEDASEGFGNAAARFGLLASEPV